MVENIYSAHEQMFVVLSDDRQIKEWVIPERNIYEDYLRTFGKVSPDVAGIAIMTDTDRTGERPFLTTTMFVYCMRRMNR